MKLNKYIGLFIASVMLLFSACTPDEFKMGAKDLTPDDLVEGIAFEIVKDYDGVTNQVLLRSKIGGKYTPLWEHPQGRSQESEVVLQIPFSGTYEVKFGVMTPGGSVYGEPVTFNLDDNNTAFVSSEIWALLAGGIGQSKTWKLDLTGDGVKGSTKVWTSPAWYYAWDYQWNNVHTASGDNYLDADPWKPQDAITPYMKPGTSEAMWYWAADYAGNSWICSAPQDYGTMTFDLIDGAHVTIEWYDVAGNVTSTVKDTYMINEADMRLSFGSRSMPLNCSAAAYPEDLRILHVDDNRLQLIFGLLSGSNGEDGGDPTSVTVFNYITQEWWDNPPAKEDVPMTDPYDGDDPNGDLTTTITTSIIWKVDIETPYDWYSWDGSKGLWTSNGFSGRDSYAATGWAPYSEDSFIQFSLMMQKDGDAGKYELVTGAGETYSGAYTIEDNWINFGQEITFATCDWVSVSGSRLRIVKRETDGSGNVEKLWLGVANKTNDAGEITEYLCLQVKPSGGNSGAQEGTIIAFDDSKLVTGDLENNGNLRLEIFNEYGASKADCGFADPAGFKFSNRLYVNFSLKGLGTLNKTYPAVLSFADADWSPQYWGEDSAENGTGTQAEVNGDGTYTVSFNSLLAAEGMMVFCVDIKGLAADVDLSGVQCRINSIVVDGANVIPDVAFASELPVDNSKLVIGNLEDGNNFRIEMFNEYGETKADAPVDINALNFSESMTITFTVSGLNGAAATGSYKAQLAYAASSWYPAWWGEGGDGSVGTCDEPTIQGDGTYTITYKPGAACSGAMVYCIDLLNIIGDLPDLSAVNVTIDKILLK